MEFNRVYLPICQEKLLIKYLSWTVKNFDTLHKQPHAKIQCRSSQYFNFWSEYNILGILILKFRLDWKNSTKYRFNPNSTKIRYQFILTWLWFGPENGKLRNGQISSSDYYRQLIAIWIGIRVPWFFSISHIPIMGQINWVMKGLFIFSFRFFLAIIPIGFCSDYLNKISLWLNDYLSLLWSC